MQGNNSIILCQLEMNKAVEFYLNEVVLKIKVNVSGVKFDTHQNTYEVIIIDNQLDSDFEEMNVLS